jgi:hypothetical protein
MLRRWIIIAIASSTLAVGAADAASARIPIRHKTTARHRSSTHAARHGKRRPARRPRRHRETLHAASRHEAPRQHADAVEPTDNAQVSFVVTCYYTSLTGFTVVVCH